MWKWSHMYNACASGRSHMYNACESGRSHMYNACKSGITCMCHCISVRVQWVESHVHVITYSVGVSEEGKNPEQNNVLDTIMTSPTHHRPVPSSRTLTTPTHHHWTHSWPHPQLATPTTCTSTVLYTVVVVCLVEPTDALRGTLSVVGGGGRG